MKKRRNQLLIMRESLGWTQERMAMALKISRYQYHLLETEARPISEKIEERFQLLRDVKIPSLNSAKSGRELIDEKKSQAWIQTELRKKLKQLEAEKARLEGVLEKSLLRLEKQYERYQTAQVHAKEIVGRKVEPRIQHSFSIHRNQQENRYLKMESKYTLKTIQDEAKLTAVLAEIAFYRSILQTSARGKRK